MTVSDALHWPRRMALCAALLAVAVGTARAAEPAPAADPVTEAFSGHDPESKGWIDHSVWSEFLDRVMIEAGRSTKRLGRDRDMKRRRRIGSRLTYGNPNPSRFENNRIAFHILGEEAIEVVRAFRQGLEMVSERLELAWLSRDEQLAYWLNLYNAAVFEQIAERYPLRRLERLRAALWDEPLLTVAGHSLSLREIETRILFPIWKDPRILYGLWQGAVGGPRLPNRAYTGENVWALLERNAREFVNSNRGMKPDGAVLRASRLYEWGASLFAGEAALIGHIASYAEPPFAEGLEGVDHVAYDLYDWHIAGLIDGTPDTGQWNQYGGMLTGSMGGSSYLNSVLALAQSTDQTHAPLPAHGLQLLQGIEENNDRARMPRVRVEECRPGEDCSPSGTRPPPE